MSVPPGTGAGLGKDNWDTLPRGLEDKGSSLGGHCLLLLCLGTMGGGSLRALVPCLLVWNQSNPTGWKLAGRIELGHRVAVRRAQGTEPVALLCGVTSILGIRGTVSI